MPRLLQQSGAKKRRESKERQDKEQAAVIKVPRLDSFLTFFSQTARNEMPHFPNGSNGPGPPDADAHAITSASARIASGDNVDVSVSVFGPDEFSVSVSLTSLSTLSGVDNDSSEVTVIEVNTSKLSKWK